MEHSTWKIVSGDGPLVATAIHSGHEVREELASYFPEWIHDRFPNSVCVLSVESKKFFMDEWTGQPDAAALDDIAQALKSTVDGVLEELAKR